MREEVLAIARKAKGFLEDSEGHRLYELARQASRHGPCVEIGSYCGKAAMFLGEGCRHRGVHPLFTVDHHRGSEEQQPGQPYFDPELWDWERATVTTLQALVANIRAAGLQEWVIPIVGESTVVGRSLPLESLGLVFIDGGHSEAAATGDYETWAPLVGPGGYLCVHDVFADPAAGGQAPYHMVQRAVGSGRWTLEEMEQTLAVLRRR